MEGNRGLSCYTIGHSDLPVDVFIYFLRKARINVIVDVRSSPYSQNQPQYNRESLSVSLNKEIIDYQFMGDLIGGRYFDHDLLFEDGRVSYEKVGETKQFKNGLDRVISLIQAGNKVALMCSEKEPLKCHRFALIAKNLHEQGISVMHLIPELVQKTHGELEGEIVKKFRSRNNSFLSDNRNGEVRLAYEKLNKEIAFKKEIKNYYSAKSNKKAAEISVDGDQAVSNSAGTGQSGLNKWGMD